MFLNGNQISRNLFVFFFVVCFPFFQIFLDQMILLIIVVFYGLKYFYSKYVNSLHTFLIKNEVNWKTHMYFLSFLCTWCSIYFISFYGKRIKALSAVCEWTSQAMVYLNNKYKYIVKRRMKLYGKYIIEIEKYWLRFSKHKVSDMIEKSYLRNNVIYLLG